MGDRIKRILAFLIDWNLALLPAVVVFFFLEKSPVLVLLTAPLILAALAVFALRDLIFQGRSPGKRLLRLFVFDRSTMGQASPKQRAVRTLFFFVYPIDGIILLASGRSIGDMTAGTVVLSEKNLENGVPAADTASGKTTKIVIAVIAAVLVWVIAIMGLVLLILNSQKDSEEYQLAHRYLVTSEAFQALDAEESDIFMNQYSARTQLSADGQPDSRTVEIGFLVNSHSFTVVCHCEDGIWQVCEECTPFD